MTAAVSYDFIHDALYLMNRRQGHFYIICTKHPENALHYFTTINGFRDPVPPNLMLMTTVENQAMADLRLPVLLQIPGVLHGVSYEPALGPVDFCPYLKKFRKSGGDGIYFSNYNIPNPHLDWLICGGETGPQARPAHPDWFRQARDQAVTANVPFFFKGWGEWIPNLLCNEDQKAMFTTCNSFRDWGTLDIDGNWFPLTTPWNGNQGGL
ncbi:MAG: phage Gp37/Gp68 family protein, partial [Deltaproteobacteria bacterium]|nr:phage Gp37/Gp68 family protein [Deltaproteobacteria bacterium]